MYQGALDAKENSNTPREPPLRMKVFTGLDMQLKYPVSILLMLNSNVSLFSPVSQEFKSAYNMGRYK